MNNDKTYGTNLTTSAPPCDLFAKAVRIEEDQDTGQQEFSVKGMEAFPPWFNEWMLTATGKEIANKFIRLAYGLHKKGFKHYSHWAIANRLRWHYDMVHGPDASGYKINNNAIRWVAKLAEHREPKLRGFFEFRKAGGRS